MKVESLVIAEQQAAVNTFPGLVHTARHGMGVGFTRRRCANRKEAAGHGRISDWAEVVGVEVEGLDVGAEGAVVEDDALVHRLQK